MTGKTRRDDQDVEVRRVSKVAPKEQPGRRRSDVAPIPLRAFVVDDEPVIRRVVARWLRSAGFEVTELPDSEHAWDAMWRGLPPDLVVTDHDMPGISGLRLAQELERALGSRAPAVVVMTGSAADIPIAGNVRAVLRKPFVGANLLEALRVALGERFRR